MGKRYRVILFMILVVGIVFNFGEKVQAETIEWPVAVDETNFPDEEFRNYLKEEFEIDESLSETEMENVTWIDVSSNEKITSLEGIEYFQNLEVLYCDDTGISELDVSHNPKLDTLSCHYTKISSLDVSQNTYLQELRCNNTSISNLDISQNIKLETLYCFAIKINNLDVSQNVNLQELRCNNTNISSLDISQNNKLQALYCFATKISNLDVSQNANLQSLACGEANISSVDLSNNFNLEYFVCSNSSISSVDLSNNAKLKTLYCNATDIKSLDLSKNALLYYLDCSETEMDNLDLSNNTKLGYLNCVKTEIVSLDVSKNTKLNYLYCSKTKIESLDVSKNTELHSLDCSGTEIDSLDLSNNASLSYLNCEKTRISSLDVSNKKLVYGFNASKCKTPVLLSSENTIDLSQLSDINLSKVSNIQNATLLGGKLQVLNPLKMISYTYDCGGGNMASFNLVISWCEIKYELNGGKLLSENPNQYHIGDKLTFISPVREGYTFAGWYEEDTFITPIAEELDTAEMRKPLILYAKWEAIQATSYTITYHANGGTGQMAQATATKGKAFTLPQNGFTAPSGKRFKEWAIGNADGMKIKVGGMYSFTGATTVYAVWETIPATVQDIKKETFKDLQLKAKASKTSNKLSWKRVKGADGYVVYGGRQGKKLTEIKAATKGVSFTHKKLLKKTFYQYQVKAYRLVNEEKKFISVSQTIYSVTTGGKYDNAKKLTVNASKLTLKKGKSKIIKAKLVGTKGKKLKNYTKTFRYETSNSKIATISAKGKIKARKKGKCMIYVYAQNGLSKAIKITVK